MNEPMEEGMARRPVREAAGVGFLAALVLFGIQTALDALGWGGRPVGVVVAERIFPTIRPFGALVVGTLGFGLAGAAWGALYARLTPRVEPRSGLLFGLVPWLFSMLVVMPLLDRPLFGGSARALLTALFLNLLWGWIVGAVTPSVPPPDPADAG